MGSTKPTKPMTFGDNFKLSLASTKKNTYVHAYKGDPYKRKIKGFSNIFYREYTTIVDLDPWDASFRVLDTGNGIPGMTNPIKYSTPYHLHIAGFGSLVGARGKNTGDPTPGSYDVVYFSDGKALGENSYLNTYNWEFVKVCDQTSQSSDSSITINSNDTFFLRVHVNGSYYYLTADNFVSMGINTDSCTSSAQRKKINANYKWRFLDVT